MGCCPEGNEHPHLWPPVVTSVISPRAQPHFERSVCTVCFPPRYLQGHIPKRWIRVPVLLFFFLFLCVSNPCLIGSRVCSTLCLQPGARCWQGTQAGKASSRGGSSQEKPPGLRQWQKGCPTACSPGPGLSAPGDWPGLVPAAVAPSPLQRARETKQSPVLKETQSGLFTEPCSNLDQTARCSHAGKGPRDA